ncbi:hypothetical protein L202_05225 [Cryptococcus amylolentus CBS 6039]|uniref:Phosphoglycerate mutase n=2 Tax=Cryptococcus amylolentus TaxID=104669 RepID=A0A1E3HJP5_9TREE|nr:hypothetical protein L202_05225 [Cryptococcus amylolentus CBS 6039]ODN76564.1 hypothetical protein L202_05225 [Cryptococcus amylolentus CBS 6039]ODO04551.1 hypothetical protein I350_05155 [Cryptococcus amylolentus CBS 6273]
MTPQLKPESPPVGAVETGGDRELEERKHEFAYEVVQGFFIQNGPKPKHVEFEEQLKKSFGLIDESPERWQNLKSSVKDLQDAAPEGVSYKVFFLGRHGQGWHNLASDNFSKKEWEARIARTYPTADDLPWGPDPYLTPLGISQAQAINACWTAQAPLGAPVKQGEMVWYCSPFTRTGQTLMESWKGLVGDGSEVEVREDWRECYGLFVCDQRSTKSVIQERFPTFKIEPGFSEQDDLWKAEDRETEEHMQLRARRGLDRIFGAEGPEETYISITGHTAIFRNFLAVVGHQPYRLATGEMIPVVVKATRL